MNVTNQAAVDYIRSLTRMSAERAEALVARIDTLDSSGRTTFNGAGDGSVSAWEIITAAHQVAQSSAGFTPSELQAVRTLDVLRETLQDNHWSLPQAEWKQIAARPEVTPQPQTVASLPETWVLEAQFSRDNRTLPLRETAARIAGGRSEITLADVRSAMPWLNEMERRTANHLVQTYFYGQRSAPVTTTLFESPKGRTLELMEQVQVEARVDTSVLGGHRPGGPTISTQPRYTQTLSVKVPRDVVVIDEAGRVHRPDANGLVTFSPDAQTLRTSQRISFVRRGSMPEILETFRISLPDRHQPQLWT